MCYLFLFITKPNNENYTVDENLYECNMNIKNIIKKHEYETLTIFDWFENNLNFKSSKSQILNTFKSQKQQ